MNTKQSMHRWSAYLQAVLKGIHRYRVEALAAFSFAAVQSRDCHLSRLAAYVPGGVKPGSVLRRIQRFLGNSKLQVEAVCNEMASWLQRWNFPGAQIIVLMDETPQHNRWRVLKVSVCYKRRSLPLVWRTDPLAGRSTRARVQEVLTQTAMLLQRYAPQTQVTLLADRGFCWATIMKFCRQNGWHFVLRAQSKTTFRWQDEQGKEHFSTLGELVAKKGDRFVGQGVGFKKAGGVPVNVVACWLPRNKEAWLLVTDLPPSFHLVRRYRRRMWQEQSFRDEKSHGFGWQGSAVTTAARMHHLLLILALAQLWLSSLGEAARCKTSTWCPSLGLNSSHLRLRWSIFRCGWEMLRWCLNQGMSPPYKLEFSPP